MRRLEAGLRRRGLDYTSVPIINNPTRDGGRMSATLYLGEGVGEHLLRTASGYRARAVVLPKVTVVNVHSPATDEDERTTFFRELIPWARSLPQPVLLSGDFNLTPTHGAGVASVHPGERRTDGQTYASLMAAFPLQTHFTSTTVYGWPFDHVMGTAGRIHSERKLAGRKFPQDHDPLLVEVVVPTGLVTPAPVSTRELPGGLVTHGFDAITGPGSSATLHVKVERDGLGFSRPDLKHYPVRFSVLGRTLEATSDGEGVAHATLTAPSAPGVYAYSAYPEGRSDAEATGRVWVLDPARPLAVVDIDGTLSDMAEWRVPFVGHKAKAFPDSPELLRDLARTHQVVYLTARDDALAQKTRAFLTRRGFPDGPVIYDDLGLSTGAERDPLLSLEQGAFKLRELRKLQALGLNVALGIGNSESDARAHERAGVRSFIRSKPRTGVSVRFGSYADLRQQLERVAAVASMPGLVRSVSAR